MTALSSSLQLLDARDRRVDELDRLRVAVADELGLGGGVEIRERSVTGATRIPGHLDSSQPRRSTGHRRSRSRRCRARRRGASRRGTRRSGRRARATPAPDRRPRTGALRRERHVLVGAEHHVGVVDRRGCRGPCRAPSARSRRPTTSGSRGSRSRRPRARARTGCSSLRVRGVHRARTSRPGSRSRPCSRRRCRCRRPRGSSPPTASCARGERRHRRRR